MLLTWIVTPSIVDKGVEIQLDDLEKGILHDSDNINGGTQRRQKDQEEKRRRQDDGQTSVGRGNSLIYDSPDKKDKNMDVDNGTEMIIMSSLKSKYSQVELRMAAILSYIVFNSIGSTDWLTYLGLDRTDSL